MPVPTAPTWEEVLALARRALELESAALDREQAVTGIDALDEHRVQTLIAGAFGEAGLGVSREFPYFVPPGAPERTRERERCDVVLTPSPDLRPRDAVAERRERADAAGSLFAGVLFNRPPGSAEPEQTLWIEIKVAGQYAYTSGVPGPSRGYSSLLMAALRQDIAKLATEGSGGSKAALLVLFAESIRVTDHDVPAALHRCMNDGLPVGSPRATGFSIADRIGNSWCALWLVPVRS